VYLMLVLVAPLTITLHERFGWLVPVALVLAIGATDAVAQVLRAPGVELINLALV
jgi:hypothetical protein